MACIEARGLRKSFGTTVAVDGVDLRVEEGRILGLIGPNGAGKTTALNAILGLTPYQGELKVLGRDPWTNRDQLMRDVCFIADVAVLPRWIRVSQALGLDILYRKQFYDSLLNDYFDRTRTIVVTTHQVEEVQDVLTDLMFINRGRIVLNCSMEEFELRYVELMVRPENIAAARALKPIHERQVFGRIILLFDHVDRQQLAGLGDVRTPSITDLFVAVIGNQAGQAQGAAR
jgi:ABC-type multidrug transport system ATPase subunit